MAEGTGRPYYVTLTLGSATQVQPTFSTEKSIKWCITGFSVQYSHLRVAVQVFESLVTIERRLNIKLGSTRDSDLVVT